MRVIYAAAKRHSQRTLQLDRICRVDMDVYIGVYVYIYIYILYIYIYMLHMRVDI